MNRRINLLLTFVCIVAIAFTYILPFIQHDLYTNPSMFDLYAKRHPQLIVPGAIMQGKYYMNILSVSIGCMILQTVIISVRNSKTFAFFNLFLGISALTITLIMALTIQVNHDYHNFAFLSGFYILIGSLITKILVDGLYLKSILRKRESL